MVPGIGFSPDRLLQGRLFSYGDTHRYRLGINHHQIPVNAPSGRPCRTRFIAMAACAPTAISGGRVNYEPNRFGDFAQDASVNEPALAAGAVERYDHREDDDYYSQPGALFRLFDDAQQRAPLRQHRTAYFRRAERDRRGADRALPSCRSGVRGGRGRGARSVGTEGCNVDADAKPR